MLSIFRVKILRPESVNDNKTEQNEKWPYIPEHPYRIIIIGGSGPGKTNALINLINEQKRLEWTFDWILYEYFIKKREDARIKHLNNPNAFIKCSNTMDDVYENINDYSLIRKRKKIFAFDDMIADIMTSKKFQAIIK